MTEGDAPQPDAAHDDAPLVVPPGVPLRVADWLLPPLLVVLLAGALAAFIPVPAVKPYLVTTAGLVVLSATVQAVFGFRSYTRWDDADIVRHRRSVTVTLAALAVFSLPFVHGLVAAWLFAGAGYRIASDPARGVGRVRALLSARAWVRVRFCAVVLAVVAILAQPVASAFGFAVPDVVLMAGGSLVAGFAHRSHAAD
ncbi:hypothetical protein [Leifsonia sp. EB34]|uniref:hypothetical protein n=1 Tax=Leifsonia sp. EB34 TaxID=3156303 RepID=UPI0035110A86